MKASVVLKNIANRLNMALRTGRRCVVGNASRSHIYMAGMKTHRHSAVERYMPLRCHAMSRLLPLQQYAMSAYMQLFTGKYHAMSQ